MNVPKTAEHEVKVRFAREFADVGSVTENFCLAPESLSSASSFHSLSSTLSTKSGSSSIYPDSTLETADDAADISYVNSNIPGVEDLILACADIHLGSEHDESRIERQDLSQDQTFASATDETPFLTSDCSLNEDLLDNADDKTQVIETNSQLHETTLNQTHILGSSNNTLPVQNSQFVISYPPAEEYVLQVEKSIDEHIPLQESDNIVSELETCNIASSIANDSLPASNANDNQLNITTTASSGNITFNVIALSEEQVGENNCTSETLSLEDPQLYPTEISVPSISSLAQYADLSLPGISSISLPLEDTDSKTKETNIQASSQPKQDTSAVLSPSDNLDKKLCVSSQIIVNSVQAEKNEIIKQQELPQLDNYIVSDKKDNIQLNETSIIESKTSEVKETLQTSIDKKDLETENSVVLNEIQKLSEEEIAICNETRVIEKQCNSETVIVEKEKYIVESTAATSAVKKETSVEEDLDRTLTLQEIDINFEPEEHEYEEFKPQRQSTALSLSNGQSYIEELKSTVEKVTNELLNPSLEFTEETDQFVSATPESKYKLY